MEETIVCLAILTALLVLLRNKINTIRIKEMTAAVFLFLDTVTIALAVVFSPDISVYFIAVLVLLGIQREVWLSANKEIFDFVSRNQELFIFTPRKYEGNILVGDLTLPEECGDKRKIKSTYVGDEKLEIGHQYDNMLIYININSVGEVSGVCCLQNIENG